MVKTNVITYDIITLGSTTHLVNLTGIKFVGADLDNEMLKVLCDGNFPRLNYFCLHDICEKFGCNDYCQRFYHETIDTFGFGWLWNVWRVEYFEEC